MKVIKKIIFIMIILSFLFIKQSVADTIPQIKIQQINIGDSTILSKIISTTDDFKPIVIKHIKKFPEINIIFIALFLVIESFILLKYNQITKEIISAYFSQNIFRNFTQENNYLTILISHLMNLSGLILLTIFITNFFYYKSICPKISFNLLLSLILGSILIWFFIKQISIKIFSLLFETKTETNLYKFHILLKNSLLFLFFPFLLMFFLYSKYTDFFLTFTLFLLILNYLYHILHMALLIKKKEFPLFFYILYLCTVEILPVLIAIKLIMLYCR